MHSYVSRLGLHFDPFDGQGDEGPLFFDFQRQALLQQLSQASASHVPLMLLTGPLGSGKTTIMGRMASQIPACTSVLQLQATLFMGKDQLLHSICLGLGLDDEVGDGKQRPQSLIYDYLSQIATSGRELLLCVDDAHELGDDAFRVLLDILAFTDDMANLQVLLAGEQQLLTMVDKLLAATEIGTGHISLELAPLNGKEIHDYLSFKLESAGYCGPFPISTADMEILVRQSGGVLATINVLARDSLDQLSPDQPSPVQFMGIAQRPGLTIPRVYWVIAAVLTLALLLTLLVNPGETEPTTITLAVPSQLAAPIQTNDAPILTAGRDIAAAPVVSDLAVATEVPAIAAATEAAEIPEIATATQVSEVSEGAVETVETDASEQRLMAMAPETYTLQMLGSHSEANVLEFISRQVNGEQFAYFESRYQDRPWYVAVFGSYANREQADAAKSALPAELQKLNPWVRNLAAIHSDIQKFNP